MSRTSARIGSIAAIVITCAGFWSMARLRWDTQARLSYDSVRYYAGAISIAASGRYLDLDGTPQQVWPPRIPLLYAALSRITGRDPLAFVPLVNGFAYLFTMAALFLLGRISGMRWWTVALVMAAIGWNSHYASMQNKLWSEPVTLALLVVTLACAAAALRNPERASYLIVAACAAAAAAITMRYAAVAVVPVLMVVALMARRPWLALAPLATPLPLLLTLSALGASQEKRSIALQAIPWLSNGIASLELADQFVPQRFTFAVGGIVAILLWVGAGPPSPFP
ncbi:MAG TPA: hypothetical protein VF911_20820, partial [Thermoanaerobaculia bacterium]